MTRLSLLAAALAALAVVGAGRIYDCLSWAEVAGLALVAGAWAVVYGVWWEGRER